MILMHRIALKFAYDGSKFHGSQRQPDVHTVEDEIINGLDKLNASYENISTVSRTDKGVHSLGNVICFDTDFNKEEILGALNSQIQNTWILGITEVPKNFNPRYQVKSKHYRYYLPNLNQEHKIKKLKQGAKLFQGKHDFQNFTKSKTNNSIRKIDLIKVKEKSLGNLNFVTLDFFGKSFLWEMIRKIVTGIKNYSTRDLNYDELRMLLNGSVNRGIESSNPENLILMEIKFENLEFKHDPKVNNNIRNQFLQRKSENLVKLIKIKDMLNKFPE